MRLDIHITRWYLTPRSGAIQRPFEAEDTWGWYDKAFSFLFITVYY